METRTIVQHLALAEDHVQHCDVHLKRQRGLLKHLQRHSLGTFHARRHLKELADTQACFVAYRDQLKSEMALSAARIADARGREEVPGNSAEVGVFFTAQGMATPRQS